MIGEAKEKFSRSIVFVLLVTWELPGMKCTRREMEKSFVG